MGIALSLRAIYSACACPLAFGGAASVLAATYGLVRIHILPTVAAKQTTATIELAFVLGYTFHAHSCTMHTAYINTGFIPLRHSKNGVDQMM